MANKSITAAKGFLAVRLFGVMIMNTFSKICLLLLAGFFLICVCSFAAKAERGGRNRPARLNYNLKQPKVDASEEWKKVAGKVWACETAFTVTGRGERYYWRFFKNQERQYWLRAFCYYSDRGSPSDKKIELERINLDKHFIRKVNSDLCPITWGISGDKLIVPAVVKVEPQKWSYSRLTREGKQEEYFYEFENELKSGGSGTFRLMYKRSIWHFRASTLRLLILAVCRYLPI